METTGVLVLTCGTWILYCGYKGIPVLATVQAVISDPSHAADIISKASTDSAAANAAMKQMSNTALTGAVSVPVANGLTAFNPFAGKSISSGFGARGGEHQGIDYPMPVGTPLPAAFSGVLSYSSGGRGGNVATVKASNGYSVEYMHLSREIPALNGKQVTIGQVIGYSGGAKGAPGAGDSTGPHVHFQVNTPSGTPVNPQTYFGK